MSLCLITVASHFCLLLLVAQNLAVGDVDPTIAALLDGANAVDGAAAAAATLDDDSVPALGVTIGAKDAGADTAARPSIQVLDE